MKWLVVDSSVVAKWVLPEDDNEQAERLLRSAESDTSFIVLDLALVEAANAIWNRRRRQLLTVAQAEGALHDLLEIVVHIEPARLLLDSALQIGSRYDRAIYDALFVALVSKTGFPGVAADEPLYNVVHGDYPSIVLLRDWK